MRPVRRRVGVAPGLPWSIRGPASVALSLVVASCASAVPGETLEPTGTPPATTTAAPTPLATEGATPSPRPPTPAPAPTGPAATSTAGASAGDAFAGAWEDVTAGALGQTAEWTNKVELADVDGDGDVDILFANGGDYDQPGTPVASRAFLNAGDGTFVDATSDVFGNLVALTRVIVARDLDADGAVDIFMGTTYNTQSRLLLGGGDGSFEDVTEANLPSADLSLGDAEAGDVDGDGDLDLMLADWGDDGPVPGRGLVTLWLNDGAGAFTDATGEQMPDTLVGFSWDLELVDVDNDWDLDAAVSCKLCPTSLLYENDGSGTFTDVTPGRLPPTMNNYEFAPVDLDGDGFLDLVTINDGRPAEFGLSENVFRNAGDGSFADATGRWWPPSENRGWDDNVVVGLDIESDGDADFLVGSLDGPDRLLINDGSGRLALAMEVFDGRPTGGTLGMAVADLNGDSRPDVVQGQGEVPGHEDERVFLATEVLQPDTAPPIVTPDLPESPSGELVVHARIHDNRTPNMAHDWRLVEVRWDGGSMPMQWYGENLFRASVTLPADADEVQVCAVDVSGNETCSP